MLYEPWQVSGGEGGTRVNGLLSRKRLGKQTVKRKETNYVRIQQCAGIFSITIDVKSIEYKRIDLVIL